MYSNTENLYAFVLAGGFGSVEPPEAEVPTQPVAEGDAGGNTDEEGAAVDVEDDDEAENEDDKAAEIDNEEAGKEDDEEDDEQDAGGDDTGRVRNCRIHKWIHLQI
eukprot:gene15629-18533_t